MEEEEFERKKRKVIEYVNNADLPLLHLLAELAEAYSKRTNDTWWEKLKPEEKASIQKGLADSDNDRVVSHNEVMNLSHKWH